MKHLKDEGYVVTLDALSDLRVQLSLMANTPTLLSSVPAANVLAGLDSNMADKWQHLRREHDSLIKALSAVQSFVPVKE